MEQASWVLKKRPAAEKIRAAAREFQLRPLVVELLLQRGFGRHEEILHFLHPRLKDLSDPFLLPEMDLAASRVLSAVDARETVVLYGDYDVDGVTSLTLLHAVLKAYGLTAHTFLPHRIDEGYGLNEQGIGRCLKEFDPSLIIAADCGTSSLGPVRDLKARGIDVVILDHHECSAPERPPAVALVNPKLGQGFHYLCSAGVVFKLAHAMLKRRRIAGFDLRNWLDIVALGTVADLVPLVGENRILVRKGLQQMASSLHAGVSALKSVSGVNGCPEAYDIGFKLGPRLNAAGRLDTAQASLDLLMCRDLNRAQSLARGLDALNRDRQALEQRIRDEAMEQLRGFDAASQTGIVLGSEHWHAGVVGIVASRVSKEFHRPTFIIAFGPDGEGKGSGRSIPGVSLVEAIEACRDLLVAGGGHEMAAGLSVKRQDLDAFRQKFCDYIAATTPLELLRPRIDIDLEATFEQLNMDLLDSYELVHPMGMGNPQPLFMSRRVQVAGEPRVLKEKHLKIPLYQAGTRLDAIYFNAADKRLPPTPWDIAYHISRNIYRGCPSLSMSIEAVRTTR